MDPNPGYFVSGPKFLIPDPKRIAIYESLAKIFSVKNSLLVAELDPYSVPLDEFCQFHLRIVTLVVPPV